MNNGALFKKIQFGFADAEQERRRDEKLILKGQIDYDNAIEKALNGYEFLFLGYKGAGKSSLAQRIDLQNKQRYNHFVKLISLKSFSYGEISRLIDGKYGEKQKFPIAWNWLLLVYIVESLALDNSRKDDPNFEATVKYLRKIGISGESDKPNDIFITTTSKEFKAGLKCGFELSSSLTPGALKEDSIPNYVDYLKKLIIQTRSPHKHILIIDGLDEILNADTAQYRSLEALISEVNNLNNYFQDQSLGIKLIIVCRTDLFNKIPGSNKNKIRRDSSLEFNWYSDPRNPEDSLLIKAAQLRTELTTDTPKKLFGEIIPPLTMGKQNLPVYKYLLDMTRHTPRDFLQLLKEIQSFVKDGVTSDSIYSGIRSYSEGYFIGEIYDEVNGYISSTERDEIMSMFGKLKRRDFDYMELLNEANERGLKEESLLASLNALYNCSAIGNRKDSGGRSIYDFRYQNRGSEFNRGERIILHKGLWKYFRAVY